MRFCYIDEAGDAIKLPNPTAIVSPVLVLAGIFIDRINLHNITLDFLDLKERFFPSYMAGCYPIGRILLEIKGSDVRRTIRSGRKKEARQAIGFLDKILELLERYEVKIVARILVKRVANDINETNVYTSYMQAICTYFQRYLESEHETGLIIADSRLPQQNETVSHSIFTQKFKRTGDDHDRVLEMPTFGHSANHAGIQIADIVSSGMLFPMAAYTYSTGHVNNVHINPAYETLTQRFGPRLKALQFRFEDRYGRMRGGITVSDEIGERSSGLMFKTAVQAAE